MINIVGFQNTLMVKLLMYDMYNYFVFEKEKQLIFDKCVVADCLYNTLCYVVVL